MNTKCKQCNATGIMQTTNKAGVKISQQCNLCGGTGFIPAEKKPDELTELRRRVAELERLVGTLINNLSYADLEQIARYDKDEREASR